MEWAGNGWFYQHHFFSQVVVEGHVVLDPPESTHLRFTPKDKRRYTFWWYDNCSMPDERNHIQNPHPLNCSWLQIHCAWSTSWVYQGALIVDPLALHMKWKPIGTHSYILVPTLCCTWFMRSWIPWYDLSKVQVHDWMVGETARYR